MTGAQDNNLIPHLRRTGEVTQLYVDGNPFLILGGELGNSTASDPLVLEEALEKSLLLRWLQFPIHENNRSTTCRPQCAATVIVNFHSLTNIRSVADVEAIVGATKDVKKKIESAGAIADMKKPLDARVRLLRAFDSPGSWLAMSEAILGRVEWSCRDLNPESHHAMVV